MNSGIPGTWGFPTTPVAQRFQRNIEMRDGCWYWSAAVGRDGYGRLSVKTDVGHRMRLAHRVAWELMRGPILAGLQVDHLCRNRTCVNPDHMELVTSAENTRRGESALPRAARTVRS